MANVQLRENLRNLRRRHNFTQLQISSRLNISRQAYSNYETGKSNPDLDTLLKIAEVLETDVDGLIFVNTELSLMSGNFVRVRVTGAYEYDLIGEAEDEFTE